MKPVKEEKNPNVRDLSKKELENTYGGAWWEIVYENGVLMFIFHRNDD